MVEEELNASEKINQRVLGDVTNTVRKRNHPLLPGKFLIGNDIMIRKPDTDAAAIASEDPTKKKQRTVGELVNVNKGKQKVNWSSADSKFFSISSNPLLGQKLGFLGDTRGKDGDEHARNFSSESLISQGELPNVPLRGGSSIEFLKLGEKSSPRQPMHEDKLNIPGKNCSCSVCLEARFLWADLLYEDRKGRLMEVKKSRRGAKNLVRGVSCHEIGERVGPNNEEYGKLEEELRQLWKALFVHVESLLTIESSQLQSSLLKLQELRESCMRDAETKSGHRK